MAQTKTFIDKHGKELVAELKAVPAKIDAGRKVLRDTLDAIKDEVRKPLTEWENAEDERIERIEQSIQAMRDAVADISDGSIPSVNCSDLAQRLELLKDEPTEAEYQEQIVLAQSVHTNTVKRLTEALTSRKAYEAQQAEIEALKAAQAKAEQEKRENEIAEQAAEKARLDEIERNRAEQARIVAEREREDAETKRKAEQAEREKQEAIDSAKRAEQAAKDAEAQRIEEAKQAKAREAEAKKAAKDAEAERKRLEAEKLKRQKDAFNSLVKKAADVSGVDQPTARKVILAYEKAKKEIS